MHKIENNVGRSTDVLKLFFYTLSFFSYHAEGFKTGSCLPTANTVFNRKTKCILFSLIFFFNLFLAKEMVFWGLKMFLMVPWVSGRVAKMQPSCGGISLVSIALCWKKPAPLPWVKKGLGVWPLHRVAGWTPGARRGPGEWGRVGSQHRRERGNFQQEKC